MSVRSAAYCYEPEQPFDAYNFERWNQNRQPYYPDYQRHPDEDEVPAYTWLVSATRQMCERLIHAPALKPNRQRVPLLPVSSPVSAQPVSLCQQSASQYAPLHEDLGTRLLLIEATSAIKRATKNSEGYTWEELESYYHDLQEAIRAFESALRPGVVRRMLRKIPGGKKPPRDSFWNGE